MELLRRLQAGIEELYDVHVDADVHDFLIDAAARAQIVGSAADVPEQLFCRSTGSDEAEIGLYIAAEVLQRLQADDPFVRLHEGNLEDFCIAAEGVSHFVFLAWHAAREVSVSALELELQAEIDKFCLCTLLWQQQGVYTRARSWQLYALLFEGYTLQVGLSALEQERYHTASHAAARQVAQWLRRGDDAQRERVLRQARAWCRRPRSAKLRAG